MDFEDISIVDFNDPDIENAWLQEMHKQVTQYLGTQNVPLRKLDPAPAWHLSPITSIWAVESQQEQGFIGWWAFAGDHPSDYISSQQASTPRDALQILAHEWQTFCQSLRSGKEDPKRYAGPPQDWPHVIDTLEPRAATLIELVRNDQLWTRNA